MSDGEADWRRAWSNGGGLGSTGGTATGSRSTGGRGGTVSTRRSSVAWLGDSTGSTAGDRGGGVASPLSLRRIRIKQSRQFAVPHCLSWPAHPPQVKTRRMFHVKHWLYIAIGGDECPFSIVLRGVIRLSMSFSNLRSHEQETVWRSHEVAVNSKRTPVDVCRRQHTESASSAVGASCGPCNHPARSIPRLPNAPGLGFGSCQGLL